MLARVTVDGGAKVAEAEGITHADALVRLAEIAIAALNRRPDGPPPALRGHEQTAVLIQLDAGAISGLTPDGEPDTEQGSQPRSRERARRDERPFARVDNGPGLPRRVVERLLCACRVRVALMDGDRNVLDVGRTKRVVDDRMFRALLIRDRHCGFPGCTSTHKLEAHHVVHWLYGGRTDLINLVLLCSRHHHAHHEGEFSIRRVGSRRHGEFVFRRSDGRVLDRHVDPSRTIGSTSPRLETEYPHIPDVAVLSKSIGDRLDRDWAVAVLADRRHTERERSAA